MAMMQLVQQLEYRVEQSKAESRASYILLESCKLDGPRRLKCNPEKGDSPKFKVQETRWVAVIAHDEVARSLCDANSNYFRSLRLPYSNSLEHENEITLQQLRLPNGKPKESKHCALWSFLSAPLRKCEFPTNNV